MAIASIWLAIDMRVRVNYYQEGAGTSFFFWLMLFGGMLFLVFVAIILYGIISESNENRSAIRKAKKNNSDENYRINQNKDTIIELQQKWTNRSNYLRKEYEKVNALLADNYNLNILANPYRNLASVYYIYDYMSSSQETLRDTLIHEHMENGIQRILEKLDYIIDQNQEIIFQNRILESQNREVINQNKKMLNNLRNIESNTNITAQYAEIAANYSGATAYFALADYLKN